jgi:hypothetical protein
MPLHRLAYSSYADGLSQDDLTDILAACERNNPAAHLTGMLLFDSGRFVQLLEGPRDALTKRFLSIASDPRHHGVEILVAGPIDSRLFGDWSMHYVPAHGSRADLLRKYRCSDEFIPGEMSTSALEHLCLDFAAHAHSSAYHEARI